MKLLAWDTSSKSGAIAAIEWEEGSRLGVQGLRLAGELSLNVDTVHSEQLLWGIHHLLEGAKWTLSEVDVFAVGVGPGSFTGLRIGVTTARTLAHAQGKPLVGVSSLAALARPAADWLNGMKKRAVVVAATDACKGQLFSLWGVARSISDCVIPPEGESSGLWKRGVDEAVLSPDELMQAIAKKCRSPEGSLSWVVVGEGRKRYLEAWERLPKSKELQIQFPFANQVKGQVLAQLAWEAYQAGLAQPALRIYPRYLRASSAELQLKGTA